MVPVKSQSTPTRLPYKVDHCILFIVRELRLGSSSVLWTSDGLK